MKYGGIQTSVATALAAASWVTTAGYSVLTEGNSDAFNAALETALATKGLAIMVSPPSDFSGDAGNSGARVTGTCNLGIALICVDDTISSLAGIAANIVETVRATLGRNLKSVDIGRVIDENSQLGYYILFSAAVDI